MGYRRRWGAVLASVTLAVGVAAVALVGHGERRAAAAGSGTAVPDTGYPVPAGALFAAPGGGSTGACTQTEPCALAAAVRRAPVGGTVVLRGGIHRTGAVRLTKRLTLQAYPHEQVWLDGSLPVSGFVRDGSTWRKDGWTHLFPPVPSPRGCSKPNCDLDPDYPLANRFDAVYLGGAALIQVGSRTQVRPGTFAVDAATSRLYLGDDPSGRSVEATASSTGVTIAGAAAGTTVRGLGFTRYGDRSLSVVAPHVVIENDVFSWNGDVGVQIYAADTVVRGSLFERNGHTGLGGWMADRTLIEGNTFRWNNQEHAATTWSAAGAKFGRSAQVTWRDNLFEHNMAMALWMDVSSTDTVVVGNVMRDNDGIGVMFELSHGGLFASNLLYGEKAPIMVADSSAVRIYNNTLVGKSGPLLFVKDGPRHNTDAGELARGITWATTDVVLGNNLIVSDGQAPLSADNCRTGRLRMVSGADYDGFQQRSTASNRFAHWSDNGAPCRTDPPTLPAFRSATGHEKHGVQFPAAASLFVDADRGDYRLRADSPARGRGQELPADIAAATGGLRRAGPVDLGVLHIGAPTAGGYAPSPSASRLDTTAPSSGPPSAVRAPAHAPSRAPATTAPMSVPVARYQPTTAPAAQTDAILPAPAAQTDAILAASADSSGNLAFTGAPVALLSAAGAALLGTGAAAGLASRRRRRGTGVGGPREPGSVR